MQKNNQFEEPLLLLGTAGDYFEFRKKVKEDLQKKGYKNILIMEEIEGNDDRSLDRKFNRIIDEYKPSLIFAFFQNGARMDGVTFEIGWLCAKYKASILSQMLRILHEDGYNRSSTTGYIRSLFTHVPHASMNESKEYLKASTYIHSCVLFNLEK